MNYDEAEAQMRQGNYEKAYEIYRKIIEAGEADATIFNNCGVALDSLGRHREALECYQRAVALDPEYATAYYNLANCLVYLRRFDEALDNYRRALTIDPGLKEAYIDLANLYLLMNEPAMVRKTLRYVVEQYRDDPEIVYSAAIILMEVGDIRTSITLLKYCLGIKDDPRYWNALGNAYFAMDDFERAMESYEYALHLDPKNEESWNNIGFTYFSMGLMDKALESYTRAIELNPKYRQAWYNRGYTYHAIGKLNKAVHDYWMALRLEPMDEVAWNNLGNALYNLKHYMESIPYFMKAVTINPNYEIAWNNIGNALDRMGIHTHSIPFHERALSINKRFDYAWHAKGHALCALGHCEEALEYLETAIELNSEYGETWYWRGRCLNCLEQYEEAVESLKRAIELEPEFIDSYILLADIYDKLGYYQYAQKYYNMALLRATDRELRASILVKMGKYENALEYADDELRARILYRLGRYEEILEIEPRDDRIRFVRALAYEALGKFKEAYAELKDTDGYMREKRFLEYVLSGGKGKVRCVDREFCLRVGNVLLDSGKCTLAESFFAGSKIPEAYYFRGRCALRRGELRQARKFFEIAAGLGFELALDYLDEVSAYEKVSSEQKENKGSETKSEA